MRRRKTYFGENLSNVLGQVQPNSPIASKENNRTPSAVSLDTICSDNFFAKLRQRFCSPDAEATTAVHAEIER